MLSVDELVSEYSSARIAVVPSFFEGFGFPASEAMACGLPVIASARGALPEVVGTSGQAGALVEFGDCQSLADAITELALEPERAAADGPLRASSRPVRVQLARRRHSHRICSARRRACSPSILSDSVCSRASGCSTPAAGAVGTAWVPSSGARTSSASTWTPQSCSALRPKRSPVRNGRGGVLQADVFELPFDDGRFDRVICAEVMEHVHRYPDALLELDARPQARGHDCGHDSHGAERVGLLGAELGVLREPRWTHPHLPAAPACTRPGAGRCSGGRCRFFARAPHARTGPCAAAWD